jgi:hypothetical protein
MRRGKEAKSASFERPAEDQQRIRDGPASAEGARSEAASASEPAKVGEADRAEPSEAVVPAGSARRRTHN